MEELGSQQIADDFPFSFGLTFFGRLGRRRPESPTGTAWWPMGCCRWRRPGVVFLFFLSLRKKQAVTIAYTGCMSVLGERGTQGRRRTVADRGGYPGNANVWMDGAALFGELRTQGHRPTAARSRSGYPGGGQHRTGGVAPFIG